MNNGSSPRTASATEPDAGHAPQAPPSAPAGGSSSPAPSLPSARTADPLSDPRYARFVADLLGVIAYGELSGFERLSSDARFSPSLADRASLGRLAVQEFTHFEHVSAFLEDLGVTAEDSMAPFQASVDAFHERTRPGDWYESLMKAYVIDAFSGDFYRSLADSLDGRTRELIGTIDSGDGAEHLHRRLKEALSDDPRLASRLALWGRRLVGEALTQARRVASEREYLAGLLFADEADHYRQATELFSQLTRNHSRRMSALGLTA
ncbi:ferritin-like fold-containing protein [Arthrobacter sp. RIT-PI-e]|uniref:ferritin-like fold-containing protein n=1 Tax=Arthrobacter sp. RIT-PI-e TaxID=1681197 RepID=UPI0009E3EAB8|nr:ferritin-like fold-containing protein [Arthrobacter sp. RIT-PI-e]